MHGSGRKPRRYTTAGSNPGAPIFPIEGWEGPARAGVRISDASAGICLSVPVETYGEAQTATALAPPARDRYRAGPPAGPTRSILLRPRAGRQDLCGTRLSTGCVAPLRPVQQSLPLRPSWAAADACEGASP